MKITQTHLDYWAERRAPTWAKRIKRSAPRVSIDLIVNLNAGIPIGERRLEAHNLLGILRSMRRRSGQEMLAGMAKMALFPDTTINPARRAAYCKKWLGKTQRKCATFI